MERLQEAIKLAAKIHEESWNGKEGFEGKYNIAIYDAADKAAEQVGFDKRGTMPIYLMLKTYWNDALDWANNKGEEEEKEEKKLEKCEHDLPSHICGVCNWKDEPIITEIINKEEKS